MDEQPSVAVLPTILRLFSKSRNIPVTSDRIFSGMSYGDSIAFLTVQAKLTKQFRVSCGLCIFENVLWMNCLP